MSARDVIGVDCDEQEDNGTRNERHVEKGVEFGLHNREVYIPHYPVEEGRKCVVEEARIYTCIDIQSSASQL
jgi:hypothetical protein